MCLCAGKNIRCDETHCDIAGPGKPYNSNECRICWLRLGNKPADAPRVPEAQRVTPRGPGTELKKLLEALGIKPNAKCNCRRKAAEMDAWGVAGCKERRDEIAQWLRENAPNFGWADKLKAGVLAAAKGIAFQLDMKDIFGSLVDLAIQRAEEEQVSQT